MRVNSIEGYNFKGNINISGLGTRQRLVFDTIYPVLEKQVKPIKNLNLNISGSLDKKIISVVSGKEPKYIHMSAQVRSATVPTANVAVESLDSQTILQSAQEVIMKHLNSNFYKESLEVQSKSNLLGSFCNWVKDFFNINK